MTLDQIESELTHWELTLSAASHNLVDFYSLPAYQQITGSDGAPKTTLTGMTAARVYPALDSMTRLFGSLTDLQNTIDKAAELRRRLSTIFISEAKFQEIEQLLHGKILKMPSVPVPLDQRGLSYSADLAPLVTPAELMDALSHSFTAARDAVLSVDTAWERLETALVHAMTELKTVRSEAEKWNLSFPALASAEKSLATIRTQIATDPLACSDEFDSAVAPALEQARNALKRLKAQRDELNRGLLNARSLMNQLTDLHRQSFASCQERRLKVSCLADPPSPGEDSAFQALGEWLQRLEEKSQEGMLEPLLVGLEKWNKTAADCVSHERAVLDANQSLLNQRNELRGKLEALKAKARARGSSEHPDLSRIALEATQLLFTRPTPMEKASALVVDYERVLRTLTI